MERWRYWALSEFISITLPPINVWVGLNFRTEFFPVDDLLGDTVDLAGETVDLAGDPDFFCLGNVCARGAGERFMIIWLEDDWASSIEEDCASTEEDFSSKEEELASMEEDMASMEEELASKEEELASMEEDSASIDEDFASMEEVFVSKEEELAAENEEPDSVE